MSEIKDKEERLAALLLLLRSGSTRISRLAERYHARLYQLGIDAGVDVGGYGQLLAVSVIADKVEEIASTQGGYVNQWINKDLGGRLSIVMNADYASVAEAQDAIIKASVSLRYRAEHFAMSGHATAHWGG